MTTGSTNDSDSVLKENLLEVYSSAIVQLVERVSPAVVSVRSSARGLGSGLVWAANGLILTNSHVVGRATKVEVLLANGQSQEAQVVGQDPATDLALLRVSTSELTTLVHGDVQSLKVGQLILAIGNPYGFQASANVGNISGLGRSLRSPTGRLIDNVIQFSAPLGHGSSGGPLVDHKGQLIGVNTAYIARGISLAIPVTTAKWVAETLLSGGRVRRGFLGVAGQSVPLPEALVARLGLAQQRGIMIIRLEPSSPADQGGLMLGDIMITFNNQSLQTIDDLQRALSAGAVGAKATIKAIRAGEIRELTVVPAELT